MYVGIRKNELRGDPNFTRRFHPVYIGLLNKNNEFHTLNTTYDISTVKDGAMEKVRITGRTSRTFIAKRNADLQKMIAELGYFWATYGR